MSKRSGIISLGLLMVVYAIFPCAAQDFFAGDSVWGPYTEPGVNFTTGPGPGDVYREYLKLPKYYFVSPQKNGVDKQSVFDITDIDLELAIRAEICVEYWGGHIGTSGQRITVNGHKDKPVWLPQPRGTDTIPNCYYRMLLGNSSRPVPLSLLNADSNYFKVEEEDQICHPFKNNFPHYWVYAFILRIYYQPDKPHPFGEILSPKSGDHIGDNPVVEASARSTSSTVDRVDFIGLYEDHDWEGNGLYRQWHYITENKKVAVGAMNRHIGTRKAAPYKTTWQTEWLPDQHLPIRIMARIVDATGMCYMTPVVTDVRLIRKTRSVRLCKATEVPEKFEVKMKRRKSCKILTGPDAGKAVKTRLVFTGWSCKHDPKKCPTGTETVGSLNGTQFGKAFGRHHNYQIVSFAISPKVVARTSPAVFEIKSNCGVLEHACEINWPGPSLLLQFPFADTTIDTTAQDTIPADTTTPGMRNGQGDPWKNGLTLSLSINSRGGYLVYRVPQGFPYSFKLLDVQGRQIVSQCGKGSVNRKISVSAGVYLAQLKSRGRSIQRRVAFVP